MGIRTRIIKGEEAKKLQETLSKCDNLERGESMELFGMMFTRL